MVLARLFSNSTPSPLTRAIAAYRKLDLVRAPRQRIRPARPKRAIQLTAVQLVRLAESYQAGATIYELAEQFQIDRRTVSRHLHRQGVRMRLQSPSDETVDQMVRSYESGLSLAAVSKQIGMDGQTVRWYLRQRGCR